MRDDFTRLCGRGLSALPLLAICALTFCASAAEPATQSSTTTRKLVVETAGIGSKLQSKVEQVQKTIDDGETTRALEQIETLLKEYAGMMDKKDTLYVSVASDAQFDAFLRKHPGKTVRRVAWNLQKLYFLKAFILASESPEKGLQTLEDMLTIAPYSSDAQCEKGYILCTQKKFTEALKCYTEAFKLAGLYACEKHNTAPALRGKAFCLVNLNKLEEAEIAYRKSLEIDPENKIALQGLAHIRRLQEEKP